MKFKRQKAQADCTVEFQVLNPRTKKHSWEVYETMTIQASTIEALIERAHLYIGRPERIENVSAIRLTGMMTVIDQKKDPFFDHEDTIKMDLHVLRERTVPIAITDDIASGQ